MYFPSRRKLSSRSLFAAFLSCTDEDLTAVLHEYLLEIKTLAHWNRITVNEQPPAGCAILTVSDKCQIHLFLKVRTT